MIKGAIAFSLFGYNKERQKNCFDFNSYLRGLLLNIRMYRVLFPGWTIVVETDKETYNGHKALLDKLPIKVEVNAPEVLTKAMLWRLKPVFNWDYTHVLCRDLDSLPTYREAQAVQDWLNYGKDDPDRRKAAHAITDSISHTLPMLGGMIGFDVSKFPSMTGVEHWVHLFTMDGVGSINFEEKGADQTFLNKYIYPKFAGSHPSIVQHYCLGMRNTFLDGYKDHIPDIPVDGVSEEMRESNDVAGHIGAAGWYNPPTFKFLQKHQDKFKDLLNIEKQFPKIAYWVNDGTFN